MSVPENGKLFDDQQLPPWLEVNILKFWVIILSLREKKHYHACENCLKDDNKPGEVTSMTRLTFSQEAEILIRNVSYVVLIIRE